MTIVLAVATWALVLATLWMARETRKTAEATRESAKATADSIRLSVDNMHRAVLLQELGALASFVAEDQERWERAMGGVPAMGRPMHPGGLGPARIRSEEIMAELGILGSQARGPEVEKAEDSATTPGPQPEQ